MKEVIFILSSLCDPHYRKRVEEFVENGYNVKVYGYKRIGQNLQSFPCQVVVLGEISNRGYMSRLSFFNKSIKAIAKECAGHLCFYSSLDIALFAKIHIKSDYIYEVCDLTELVVGNEFVKALLVRLNINIIKKSKLTIFTSEGFFDFYNKIPKEKIVLLPNKVSEHCPTPINKNRAFPDNERIKIGYVGVVRFETIYNFIKVCAQNESTVEVHIYGIYSNGDIYAEKVKELVSASNNITYHGPFSNPKDLPSIYSEIDILLCTYTPSPGVIYAEPNKLYEAMYFKCPIIVNSRTFLGNKVEKLNIGYVIDATNESQIKNFILNIDKDSYNEKVKNCANIPTIECINNDSHLFAALDQTTNQ